MSVGMSMEVVNGYVCRNCTDVAYAKKGVDPAHPKDGPQGVYATDKPADGKNAETASRGPAVTFGGGVVGPEGAPAPAPYVPGATLNLRV